MTTNEEYINKYHECVKFSMIHQEASKYQAVIRAKKGMKWRISQGLKDGEISQEQHDELQEVVQNMEV